MSRFDDFLGVVAVAMLAWLGALAAQPLPPEVGTGSIGRGGAADAEVPFPIEARG